MPRLRISQKTGQRFRCVADSALLGCDQINKIGGSAPERWVLADIRSDQAGHATGEAAERFMMPESVRIAQNNGSGK